jgi:transposase
LFKAREVTYLKYEEREGAGVFHVALREEFIRCPECGCPWVFRKGSVERVFRTLPVGGKASFLSMEVPRVECPQCRTLRQVSLPFAEERERMTLPFKRYVLELSRKMNIKDASDHVGVSWDTVKEIQKDWLLRKFKHVRLKDLKFIGIDEVSVGKGHKYLTTVIDLKSGAVMYVGDGKGADALAPFWKRLKAARAQVKAVSMDMSKAFISAVSTNLPKAVIVFDKFHVMKLMNNALEKVRRRIQSDSDEEAKARLKGLRWLLLRNRENLDGDKGEDASLDMALESQTELALTYLMKEKLRLFWKELSKKAARQFINAWIKSAESSGIGELKRMAKTLNSHIDGLLSWWDFEISNGPVEGTNNKIQTMKRMAYGYRDMEFYKLKIMAIHNTRYELVG